MMLAPRHLTAVSFYPTSGAFTLDYVSDGSIQAPTVVFVPVSMHYSHGYCPIATGETVISSPGATDLQIASSPGAPRVSIRVIAGNRAQRRRP